VYLRYGQMYKFYKFDLILSAQVSSKFSISFLYRKHLLQSQISVCPQERLLIAQRTALVTTDF